MSFFQRRKFWDENWPQKYSNILYHSSSDHQQNFKGSLFVCYLLRGFYYCISTEQQSSLVTALRWTINSYFVSADNLNEIVEYSRLTQRKYYIIYTPAYMQYTYCNLHQGFDKFDSDEVQSILQQNNDSNVNHPNLVQYQYGGSILSSHNSITITCQNQGQQYWQTPSPNDAIIIIIFTLFVNFQQSILYTASQIQQNNTML